MNIHKPVTRAFNMISLKAESKEEISDGLAAIQRFLAQKLEDEAWNKGGPAERIAKAQEKATKASLHTRWVISQNGDRNFGVRGTMRAEG